MNKKSCLGWPSYDRAQIREIEIIEPEEDDYGEISSWFARPNTGPSTWEIQTYTCAFRENARIVAACRGIINIGALEIRGLWVEQDPRDNYLGQMIMSAIECEARKRGARSAMQIEY